MSEIVHKPLCPMLNAATAIISAKLWPQGFDLSMSAPDSLKRLKSEYASRKRITVYEGGSDDTIFDCAGTNHKFRAWHDWCHLQLDAGFDMDGERAACELQCSHIVTTYGYGDTTLEMVRVVEAEVIGQSMYWQRHKKYVTRQREFVEMFLINPNTALRMNYFAR